MPSVTVLMILWAHTPASRPQGPSLLIFGFGLEESGSRDTCRHVSAASSAILSQLESWVEWLKSPTHIYSGYQSQQWHILELKPQLFFSQLWRLEVRGQDPPLVGLAPSEVLFSACGQPLPPCVFMGLFVCDLISSLQKDGSHSGSGPTLILPLNSCSSSNKALFHIMVVASPQAFERGGTPRSQCACRGNLTLHMQTPCTVGVVNSTNSWSSFQRAVALQGGQFFLMNFWLEISVTVEENLGIERDGCSLPESCLAACGASSKSMNDRTSE